MFMERQRGGGGRVRKERGGQGRGGERGDECSGSIRSGYPCGWAVGGLFTMTGRSLESSVV